MRRLVTALLALLAVPAIALAADPEPKRAITQADERRAASIVLKRTDLAGAWKRVASSGPSAEDDLNCAYYNPNGSDLTISGDAESEFEQQGGFPSILSYADVYAKARDGAAAWSRTVKPALARCLAEELKRELEAEEGTTLRIVRHGAISFPRVAPRTAAFRIVLEISVQTVKVPLTIHIVVVGRGRAEAGLLTFTSGAGITTRTLTDFARLLSARMRKAGF